MRDGDLQQFLDVTASAFATRAAPGSDPARVVAEVFGRCAQPAPPAGEARAARMAACGWFDAALALARAGGPAAVADALARLGPRLPWARRASADPADRSFYDGHANAMILGPGGIEPRADLWIGLSLIAPGVTYPFHSHPPEEVYLPLAPGEWWNERMDWTDPGPAGLIYNPPGIRHAMRAGKTPFLALWILPL
ncbi:MAG: transcriptional regulator [Proteobacteria bacterium]|nr:transcriptional regulator [Pseudomonadota bacterium]MBS0574326.1 transcriptional regulator [Pseudomonadota bacterium]